MYELLYRLSLPLDLNKVTTKYKSYATTSRCQTSCHWRVNFIVVGGSGCIGAGGF